jgi:hypothetical protein
MFMYLCARQILHNRWVIPGRRSISRWNTWGQATRLHSHVICRIIDICRWKPHVGRLAGIRGHCRAVWCRRCTEASRVHDPCTAILRSRLYGRIEHVRLARRGAGSACEHFTYIREHGVRYKHRSWRWFRLRTFHLHM